MQRPDARANARQFGAFSHAPRNSPVARDCVVVDAVFRNRSQGKFPANREINREFLQKKPFPGDSRASNRSIINNLWSKFPTQRNREFFCPNREFVCANREFRSFRERAVATATLPPERAAAPTRKLLYRRGGLSHPLSHSLSHPLSHTPGHLRGHLQTDRLISGLNSWIMTASQVRASGAGATIARASRRDGLLPYRAAAGHRWPP